MDNVQSQITSLLPAVANGDAAAAERLLRLVYDELHNLAHSKMVHEARRGDLQTTVLVHEAYLRVFRNGDGAAIPGNRQLFFGAFVNAMRQFLVDDARKRGRLKRGGKQTPGELGGALGVSDKDPAEILAVHEALYELAKLDPQKAKIVEYRYFTGLTGEETAEMLGLSPRMVDKEWQLAKAWLHRELS